MRIRFIAPLALVSVAVVVFVDGGATSAAPPVSTAPARQIVAMPKIVGFRRVQPASGGATSAMAVSPTVMARFEVDIQNPATVTSLSVTHVTKRPGPARAAISVPVSSSANQVTVAFTEGDPLDDGCNPTRYRIKLVKPGEDVARGARITPSCTFKFTTANETPGPVVPGDVAPLGAKLDANPTCNTVWKGSVEEGRNFPSYAAVWPVLESHPALGWKPPVDLPEWTTWARPAAGRVPFKEDVFVGRPGEYHAYSIRCYGAYWPTGWNSCENIAVRGGLVVNVTRTCTIDGGGLEP